MHSLTRLFRLLEISREIPQYGYALGGISRNDQGDLAQHHYLVTMISWQLARMAIQQGAKISLDKVLEFALIHDLGELLGGDISMPYAKANPAAKKAAKLFEAENQRYLATFFAEDQEHFQKLSDEILDAYSDEALISKLADYIEVNHYKLHLQRLTVKNVEMIESKLNEKLAKFTDPICKAVFTHFCQQWVTEMKKLPANELFE